MSEQSLLAGSSDSQLEESEMLVHHLGFKKKGLVEVSLDLHSLAAYPDFPPRAGHLARLFPGWDSIILWGLAGVRHKTSAAALMISQRGGMKHI